MTKQAPSQAMCLSIILPLSAPQPRLEACLADWRRQMAAGDELLLICQGQAALEQARELAASPGPANPQTRVLALPPSGGDGPARVLGAAEAKAQVLLFGLPDCLPHRELLPRLRQAFEDKGLTGLAGQVRPVGQEGRLAALAGLELAWRRAGQDLPSPACLALRRRALLEAGGLDPACASGGGDLWDLWLRLERAGRRLEHDDQCQVQAPQPATWSGLLARAHREGREMFLARRLGNGQALAHDHAWTQAALVLAALGLLLALWGPAPERAWSLATICLLLLYPLNREFISLVAQKEPPALGPALLYCLLRPWAWTAGLLAGALGRLGGAGFRPGTING
ncbi:MAG: glycosyltransferase [Pseudomonadota bacterium]